VLLMLALDDEWWQQRRRLGVVEYEVLQLLKPSLCPSMACIHTLTC